MKTFLLALLFLGFSVQPKIEEHVRLSKIKDVEIAKGNIRRVAPPYVKYEQCGEYFIIASQQEADKPKMIYYEGKEAKGEKVQRYASFRDGVLTVEIDDKLKAPEVLLVAAMTPYTYRMSQKDYQASPCLPKPKKKG